MTEFEKADLNNNGVIEKAEWNKLALEDRRLEMIDRDLKRNAERRFTGFALGRNVDLSVYYFACFGAWI